MLSCTSYNRGFVLRPPESNNMPDSFSLVLFYCTAQKKNKIKKKMTTDTRYTVLLSSLI